MKIRLSLQRTALILFAASLAQIALPHNQSRPDHAMLASFGRATESETTSLPVFFEPNRGQSDDDVRFIGRGNGFALLLKSSEAVIGLRSPLKSEVPKEKRAITARVSMKLEGANASSLVFGTDKLDGRVSYFLGNDQSKWLRDVETYSRVCYPAVYSGIDLVFHTAEQQLEYDFNLAAGADPNAIRLRFDGADEMKIDCGGSLVIRTAAGELTHKKPVAYQEIAGARTPVTAEFIQFGDGAIGFNVGDYDSTRALVIDPTLVFSSYLGGMAADTGRSIAALPSGDVLIAGDSFSSDFLTKATTSNSDVFLGRLTKNGGTFSYLFFGGMGNDTVTGLATDATGDFVYLAGFTESTDFPIFKSVNSALAGPSDAFVVLLKPAESAILSSSLVGGSGQETSVSVAVDSTGSTYLAGRTTSLDFPTQGAIQPAYGGGDSDAFVTKLSTDGASLVYSTYLGGNGTENLLARTGIKVDSSGNAFVVGDTQSGNFPTLGALRAVKSGPAATFDGFIAKINPTGSAFVFSTFVGGSDDDFATALAIDGTGNSYITGRTRSTSFTGSSATRSSAANSDAFVAKLNATGSALTYLTFVGGTPGDEQSNAIAIDAAGVAVIAGSAGSGLSTANAIQSFFKGGQADAFVARLTSAGVVNFSTYLGGSGDEVANGVALDSEGHIFLDGFTDSQDFLVFAALRTTNNGGRDIFLARIDPDEAANRPVLLQAIFSGKSLILYGQNFDDGAKLRVNDEQQKTRNGEPDPSEVLVAKKAGKRINAGQTVQLQVVNANGKGSNLLFVTKPL
jgi:hypothetical protein